MQDDRFYQKFPEHKYIHLWAEASIKHDHELALKIAEEGIDFALQKKPSSYYLEYFRDLKKITMERKAEVLDPERAKESLYSRLHGKEPECLACGKSKSEVAMMIGTGSGFLCDGCIELCHDLVEERKKTDSE